MARTTLSQSNESLIINQAYCNLMLSIFAHTVMEIRQGWDPYGRIAYWLKNDGLVLLQWAGFDLPETDWHRRVDQISEMGKKKLKRYEYRQRKTYEAQNNRRRKKLEKVDQEVEHDRIIPIDRSSQESRTT